MSLEQKVIDYLRAKAKEENRTVSNLIETLVKREMEEKEK